MYKLTIDQLFYIWSNGFYSGTESIFSKNESIMETFKNDIKDWVPDDIVQSWINQLNKLNPQLIELNKINNDSNK